MKPLQVSMIGRTWARNYLISSTSWSTQKIQKGDLSNLIQLGPKHHQFLPPRPPVHRHEQWHPLHHPLLQPVAGVSFHSRLLETNQWSSSFYTSFYLSNFGLRLQNQLASSWPNHTSNSSSGSSCSSSRGKNSKLSRVRLLNVKVFAQFAHGLDHTLWTSLDHSWHQFV